MRRDGEFLKRKSVSIALGCEAAAADRFAPSLGEPRIFTLCSGQGNVSFELD
jgi:hypothetical protein